MEIIKARKEHSQLIARSIMDAVGEEICLDLAGKDHTLADVERMFKGLVEREDSQYSYLNTIVAVDETDGKAVGVCVGYDGARLYELRKAFIDAAARELGLDFENIVDETDDSEIYLDSLAVLPEYRGRGIARMLLKAFIANAEKLGKPAGLLVEKKKVNARRLYENVGFRQVGERPFCGVVMDHLQHQG